MDIPDEFKCQIWQDVFEDPVIQADGHTYERHQIESWFRRSSRSPKTGANLTTRTLFPNLQLRSLIRNWKEEAYNQLKRNLMKIQIKRRELKTKMRELKTKMREQNTMLKKIVDSYGSLRQLKQIVGNNHDALSKVMWRRKENSNLEQPHEQISEFSNAVQAFREQQDELDQLKKLMLTKKFREQQDASKDVEVNNFSTEFYIDSFPVNASQQKTEFYIDSQIETIANQQQQNYNEDEMFPTLRRVLKERFYGGSDKTSKIDRIMDQLLQQYQEYVNLVQAVHSTVQSVRETFAPKDPNQPQLPTRFYFSLPCSCSELMLTRGGFHCRSTWEDRVCQTDVVTPCSVNRNQIQKKVSLESQDQEMDMDEIHQRWKRWM